jgi:uncharacterized protein YbaA (DUF1428 family)
MALIDSLSAGAMTYKRAPTSFPRAVQCTDEETVVLSWVMWPSKKAWDRGMKGLFEDPEVPAMEMPFDPGRLIYGGFEIILDE